MSNDAFKFRMSAGIPGDISRKVGSTVEANQIDSGTPPTVYGNAVKMVSGQIRPVPGSAVLADVYGILVRPYPTNAGTDGLGTSTPPTSGICDILKRGYINVKVNGATAPARGGAVYIRVAAAAAGKPIGGWEAAADSSNTIQITNAYFTGESDEAGTSEIAYNL